MDPEDFECETAGNGADELNAAAGEKGVDKPDEEINREDADGADKAGGDDDTPSKEDDDGDDEEGKEGEDKQPPAKGEEEGKRNPKFEKRVSKLTSRLKEAEEELARLRSGKPTETDQRGEKANEPDPNEKPKIEDFDTYEEYVDALTDWKVDQKLTHRDAQNAGKSEHDKFVNRVTEGKKRFADFDEVVTDDVKISKAAAEAIKESEDPAGLLYYLGENDDVAERLLTLSPARQAAEIGKIEAKLANEGKKPKQDDTPSNKVTNAPDPITPPKGGAGKTIKSIDDMDADEYIQHMNKKLGVERVYV